MQGKTFKMTIDTEDTARLEEHLTKKNMTNILLFPDG